MMKGMCSAHKVAWVLVIIGALNWGLVGFFDWNLLTAILGKWPFIESLSYMLVGLSALLMLAHDKCKSCKM